MCNVVNAVSAQPKPQRHEIPQQVYNQEVGTHAAAEVGVAAPPPNGRKKALLVGINYFGTRAELRGCINDVKRMQGLLVHTYGFPSDCIMVLTDDQKSRGKPTRQNILAGMQWLTAGVQPGDVLFFHYSGHGAQQQDPSYSEEDGYDETICPCDFESAGMIVDDEIFDLIVAPLPSGAKLTGVMDCCHSGTALDLPFTWHYGQWSEDDNPCHSAGDVVVISGCQDEQTSSDGGGSYGKPMGAMTTALCNTIERNPVLTYPQLLEALRRELVKGGFEQIPSLTSSQAFDANSSMFTPCDNIVGNRNPWLGRHFRKKKHPKRPLLLEGGLGEMLMAGAVGFMVADMVGGTDGLVDGMAMGGGLMMDGAAAMADGGGMAAGAGGDLFGGLFGGGGGDFFGGGDDEGGFFD